LAYPSREFYLRPLRRSLAFPALRWRQPELNNLGELIGSRNRRPSHAFVHAVIVLQQLLLASQLFACNAELIVVQQVHD
jgi:hypothetical protein